MFRNWKNSESFQSNWVSILANKAWSNLLEKLYKIQDSINSLSGSHSDDNVARQVKESVLFNIIPVARSTRAYKLTFDIPQSLEE